MTVLLFEFLVIEINLVLVDPKGVWEGLNNGLAYIDGGVRSEHAVHVVDFVNRHGGLDERLQTAKDADSVGISIKSFTMTEALMVAEKVKSINPDATLIAGGPHIAVDGYNFMKENAAFDIAVVGEAEAAFKEILSGKRMEEINGIIYRNGEEIKQTQSREWITDMDSLLFPCYDDFDSVNYGGKMHPIENWPLVTSRGCPYSCTYCFPVGTLIHTNKGMVNIENLRDMEDGKVLSHSGKWMPIVRFFERLHRGKLVKIKARKLPSIKATANHKFHVLRNGLKFELAAEEIHKGDYLAVQLPVTDKMTYIDAKQLIGEHVFMYEFSRKVPYEKMKIAIQLHNGGLSTSQIAKKTGLSKSFVHAVVKNKLQEKRIAKNKLEIKGNRAKFIFSKKDGIPSKLPITKGLCRLFGYYLSEGSVTKGKTRPNTYVISWTFSKNESAYVEDVKSVIKSEFQIMPYTTKQGGVLRVSVTSTELALLFKKLFGQGSAAKSIPDFIMSLQPEFLQEMLKGWILGDGGVVTHNGKKMIKVSTVSHSLAYQFFIISQKLGLSPSLQKNVTGDSFIDGRKIVPCGYNYHLNFKSKRDVNALFSNIYGIELELEEGRNSIEIRDNDTIFLPVERIETEDFDGLVYNIEVDEDHTYTANGFLVNNCNVPKVIGRKFRTRSAKNILNELQYAKEKYRSKEFKVLDDNFTLQIDRAKDICQLLVNEKLEMKWTCPNGIRADRLDEELCKLMKNAGCYSVSIGVESGDPAVFEKIKKGEKLDDVESGIRLVQAAGIRVHGFFIIGLIGSTYEADMRSVEFAKRLGISASWGILVPYPGTEVWEQIKADKNARMLRDWKEGFHIGAKPKPVFDTADYTAEQRVNAYYKANMSTIKRKDIPKAVKMVIKGLIAGK